MLGKAPPFCLCWRLANAVGRLVNYHLLQEKIENQRFDVRLDDVTSTTLQPDSQGVLVAHDAGQITVSPRHTDRPLYWSVPTELLGDWVMGPPAAMGGVCAVLAASLIRALVLVLVFLDAVCDDHIVAVSF